MRVIDLTRSLVVVFVAQLHERSDEGRREEPEKESGGAGGPVADEQPAQRTGVRAEGADQPVEERVPGPGRGMGHGRGVPRRRVERRGSDSVVGRRVRRGRRGRGVTAVEQQHHENDGVAVVATAAVERRAPARGRWRERGQRRRRRQRGGQRRQRGQRRWHDRFVGRPQIETHSATGARRVPVARGGRLVRRIVPRVDSVMDLHHHNHLFLHNNVISPIRSGNRAYYPVFSRPCHIYKYTAKYYLIKRAHDCLW